MTVWPWEHIAVAYLLVSLGARAFDARLPTDAVAAAIVAGALLPDVIDKTLSWVLHVLPGGRTFGHSLLVAIPTVVGVHAIARRYGRRASSGAFAVAYLSHLPLDVLSSGLDDGIYDTGFLLWPLRSGETTTPATGVFHALELYREFVAYLGSPRGRWYIVFEVVLLSVAVAVWRLDGWPGLSWLVRRYRRTRETGSHPPQGES